MRRTWICSLLLPMAVSVAGCTAVSGESAITQDRIGDAIADIKKQVSIYVAAQTRFKEYPQSDTDYITASTKGFKCGSGTAGFNITAVKLELNASGTGSYSLGAAPPGFPSPGVALPNFSAEHSSELNQKREFMWYLVPNQKAYTKPVTATSPISDKLLGLRKALLDASTEPGVCFLPYNPKDREADVGDKLTLGLSVTESAKSGVQVGLAPLVLSASGSYKSVTGNTLYIYFEHQSIPGRKAAVVANEGDANQMQQIDDDEQQMVPF